MPTLRPWAEASNWSAVDSSSIGPVAYGVEIPATGARANVVALLHPSFSPSNQRYRRTLFAVAKPEVEMVKSAIGHVNDGFVLDGSGASRFTTTLTKE